MKKDNSHNDKQAQCNDENSLTESVFNEEELVLLSDDPAALPEVDVDATRMQSLRSHIMGQLDEAAIMPDAKLLTVSADSGNWQKLSDKVRKKILHIDNRNDQVSFLLRIDPGAEDAAHRHTSDEHCMVLEGDVSFGNVHLFAGDYHLAPKGSWHEKAYSKNGALLYIQTGASQQSSI